MFKFQSRSNAAILYFNADAQRLLEIVGKEASPQGILTQQQIPAAIAALEAAIRAEDERLQGTPPEPQAFVPIPPQPEPGHDTDTPPVQTVSLRQRAQPLLQLLRESHAADEPVVWGV